MQNSDTLEAMLAQAASIGIKMREADAAAEGHLAQAKKAKGEASDSVTALNRAASGYAAPRFTGIAAVAEVFGQHINDPDTDMARDVAAKMASSYMVSYTGATDKTKKGGTESGVARLILLGSTCTKLLTGLQQRIAYYQKRRDDAAQIEDAGEAKAERDLCDRYLIVADSGNPKKGTPPKWNGRPASTVQGVDISKAGGTNRMALLAYAAGLVAVHGTAALHPDVLDAVLDNGGKADKPGDGLAEIAAQARALIQRLDAEFGGANTGDAAQLNMTAALLDRIAQHGFKAERERPARATPPVPPPAPVPQRQAPPPAPVQSAPVQSAPPASPDLLNALKLPEAGGADTLASDSTLDALEAALNGSAAGSAPPAEQAQQPAKPRPPRTGRPPRSNRAGIA